MSRFRHAVRASLLLLLAGALPLAAVSAAEDSVAGETNGEWRFRVLLDGKNIGFHHFDVDRDGEQVSVKTRAEFDVKFLFFNAYSYRHSLKSTWQGSCLETLESQTNANGDEVSINARRREQQFLVAKDDEETALPSCVMNFAYWDPRILEQSRLLNPQTGEYLDVNVASLGDQEITIGERVVAAVSYRITAKDMQIDLWYSRDGQRWIALESLTRGDRVIRYERENYDA